MSDTRPRVKRRTPFVIVESATARDTRLKYADLGLLTYLLDQSEDWAVRSDQLSTGEGREGRDAVRKMLHRLASFGYYRLERRRFRNGKTAMGTAISDHPVEQWATDYVTFGHKLDIPVVEQEDGTFRVKYPDGTLGSDGFDKADAPPGDAEHDEPADDEPGPEADDEPNAEAAPPAPSAKRVPPARKPPAAKKTTQEKVADAEEKAAQEKALDEEAQKVATWWWEHAEKHLGKYAGQRGGFVAVRKMIRRALAVGYSQQQCAKALQHARKHFPAAQQWQDALGTVTQHIQPKQPNGRIPYSDSATWGAQSDGLSSTPTSTDDDADDATFGVVERP
ncbi:hypothetical protein ACK03K_33915 [[Kitasatospora] papulosa]|uniref:hypothetical protein n=1 Tax=[Kitasatospora] papulosa TaxID=1464011 RepID=UPI003907FCDE